MKPNHRIPGRRRIQQAFTLLEVLVALFVFSLGLLGLAALQGISKQYNFEAVERTRAAYLANDIIERMRANRGALDSYDASDDSSWRLLGAGSLGRQPTPDCLTEACTGSQLATYDLWAFEQGLDGAAARRDEANVGGLVAPTGCIRQSGGGQIEVAIAWRSLTKTSNPGVATGCTVAGRYGDDDRYRRVLALNTFVGG